MDKDESISIIRSLLTSTKSDYTISMLNNDFKKCAGIDIPLYGYGNVSDFLQSIPHTVKVTGTYPAQKVHLVGNEKTAHIMSLVSKQKNPLKRGGRKKKGNSKSQNQIFNSLENRKPESPYSEPTSSNSLPPKLRTEKIVPPTQEPNLKQQSLLSNSVSTVSKDSTFLRLVFPLNGKIPTIDLDFYAKVGDYIEVCPSEILNPFKFYVQLRKYKRNLMDLTNKLQVFYLNEEKLYKIPSDEIKQNQTCVVLQWNSWHRAEVISCIDNSLLNVLLVDYGAKITTRKTNLRFLHQYFANFPKQAILASLANIKPYDISEGWSKNANQRFFNLAYQKDLVAGIVRRDLEIPWLNLALTCTGDSDIHINDTLVEEGMAKFETTCEEREFNWKIREKCIDKYFF